jgi:hypothetical protein
VFTGEVDDLHRRHVAPALAYLEDAIDELGALPTLRLVASDYKALVCNYALLLSPWRRSVWLISHAQSSTVARLPTSWPQARPKPSGAAEHGEGAGATRSTSSKGPSGLSE